MRQQPACGRRTCPGPTGDAPGPDDTFDLYATDLKDLHAQLR
ncbi:hypothetical protein [Promicromonospora sp. NPDC090134]